MPASASLRAARGTTQGRREYKSETFQDRPKKSHLFADEIQVGGLAWFGFSKAVGPVERARFPLYKSGWESETGTPSEVEDAGRDERACENRTKTGPLQ